MTISIISFIDMFSPAGCPGAPGPPDSSALTVAALSQSSSFLAVSLISSLFSGGAGALMGSGLVSSLLLSLVAGSSSQELVVEPLSSSDVNDGLSDLDFLYSVTSLSSWRRL